ncbi:glycosyltransferase family 69 protein [Aspergillus undulatus]|uniref:glycosyltransferase family 69 protein n=1 Tax=Aspergillus undulatus TaxID=1810928 RepID=UPI003CCCF08A
MSAHLLPDSLSAESQDFHDLYEVETQSQRQSLLEWALQQIYSLQQRLLSIGHRDGIHYQPLVPGLAQVRYYRRHFFRLCYYIFVVLSVAFLLVTFTSFLFPSYTRLPPHYASLYGQVLKSNHAGRGNSRNEKVFIAASLYDPSGELARGHWATSVLQLINLLGEANAFLSVYENDSGDEGKSALAELETQVPCNKTIIYEHLNLDGIPKITVPGGDERVKRIAYLAETRNRALQPLDSSPMRFDKILYLNDVAFDPVDALQLLFSTNVDDHGVPQYRAACAVDFINPFKFYDTYATRDLEGYSMGLPFYPWFSSSGNAQSRKDVRSGNDAVPVRSCWGGMVAFDAQFFQKHTEAGAETLPEIAGGSLSARFRALKDGDLFWDASECCLIHADIQKPRHESTDAESVETGIYLNPFVRVAYDTYTLSWLWTTRRFEKLYTIVHTVGNNLVGLPWFNPRRGEIPGQSFQDTVYTIDVKGMGLKQTIQRIATHDGFCGRPGLQVVVPDRQGGKKRLESIPMPD